MRRALAATAWFLASLSLSAQILAGVVSVVGPNSPGPPLTYAARTDSCVVYDAVNCPNATGAQGSALSFLAQNGDPMPWYATGCTPGPACKIDPVNTAILDPDFGSYETVLTSGPWGNSVGLGVTPTQNFNESAGAFDP